MFINFIKKRLLKSLAKDVAKGLPELKERALKLIEDNKDEVVEKIKAAIKAAVTNYIKEKLGK